MIAQTREECEGSPRRQGLSLFFVVGQERKEDDDFDGPADIDVPTHGCRCLKLSPVNILLPQPTSPSPPTYAAASAMFYERSLTVVLGS